MVDNRLIMPSVLDCPSRRAGATEQKLLSFALQLAGHYLKYCKKGVDKLESGKKRSGLEFLICGFIQVGERG